MGNFLRRKKVLVLGGTGSIGSVVVKELIKRNPSIIRIFSRDDTKQHDLQLELGKSGNLRYLLGDIRDRERLAMAMEGIDYVIHAAALKHVPLCDYNPFEAVKTNVIGTQNVIETASAVGVKKVVFISTDKAVYPVNVLGITKALAEKLIVNACLYIKNTRYCAVRFGNVLGTRGSLIPIIEKQLREGLPVTITDGTMTRFIMSKAEAVELILYALEKGGSGEIYVKKMRVATINNLVGAILEYFGYKSGYPVDIIGIRKGEKRHEDLATRDEILSSYDLGDKIKILSYIEKPRAVTDFNQFNSYMAHNIGCDELTTYLKDSL